MSSSQQRSVCQENNFDALFLQHAESLRNFCLYQCKDVEQAEDYVQEAFLRLWKNCAVVPFAKAKAFLFRAARNLFLNQVEHQQVVKKYLRRQSPRSNHEHPQFQVEHQELLERVEQAIANLSNKQRTVFLLHRIDGKSYKEIAEMLNISVKSVEKRMHRALLALRVCLPQL